MFGLVYFDPTISSLTANLPLTTETLFGRSHEIIEVSQLLRSDNVRMLIVVGLGGMGKTVLSRSVGAHLSSDFRDGICFVSLANITDPDLLLPAINQALHVPEPATGTLEHNLNFFLRQKHLLLILDGFENLAAGAPRVVEMLAAAPEVKALITSRIPLPDIDALEYVVPPLVQEAAIALFVERARTIDSAFVLTTHNTEVVAHICAVLDGLPLAIELAAAQCAQHSPDVILAQLRQHPTQQAMQAIVAWSYAMLDEIEQRLFATMAVFVGGWTADAAIQVYIHNGRAQGGAAEVWDRLAALVTKNLVQQDEDPDGEARFSMLAPICDYARERLGESGNESGVRTAHAAYYTEYVETADLSGAQQERWRRRLEAEQANIRAAFDWAVEQADGQTALRICGEMWRFWHNGGYLYEGWGRVRQALALNGTDAARAKVLNGAGVLAWAQGDYAAAVPILEQSLALQRLSNDRSGIADVLNLLGLVARAQSDFAEAYAYYQESITLRRQVGNKLGVAYTLNNLGLIARDLGNPMRAVELFSESLTMCHDLHDVSGAARALNNRGATYLVLGDVEMAQHDCQQSLRLFMTLGDKRSIAECLEALTCILGVAGDTLRAAQLTGAALTLRENIGAPMSPAEYTFYQQMRAPAPSNLNDPTYHVLINEGRMLSLENVISIALREMPI